MNILTTAFIFILLNFAQAGQNRQIRMSLEKTTGFLWIFKYVNYKTEDKTTTTDYIVNVNQKTYDWYFWSGYYEKFASGLYLLELKITLNSEPPSLVSAKLDSNTNPKALVVTNLELPEVCKDSENYSYTVANAGWVSTKKVIEIKFKCTNSNKNPIIPDEGQKEMQQEVQKLEENVALLNKPSAIHDQVEGDEKKLQIIEKENSKLAKKEVNLLNGVNVDSVEVDNQLEIQNQEQKQEIVENVEEQVKKSSVDNQEEDDDEEEVNKSKVDDKKIILL